MESRPSGGSGKFRPGSNPKFIFWIFVSVGVNFLVSGGGLIYLRQLYATQQLSQAQAELWGIAVVIGGPLVGCAILIVSAWRVLRTLGRGGGGS